MALKTAGMRVPMVEVPVPTQGCFDTLFLLLLLLPTICPPIDNR